MFHVETIADHSYIQVLGDLDCVDVPQLKVILDSLEGCKGDIHVDLRNCTYIESSGISLFILVRRTRGESFCLHFGLASHIRHVLEILNLIEFFAATDDVLRARDLALKTDDPAVHRRARTLVSSSRTLPASRYRCGISANRP